VQRLVIGAIGVVLALALGGCGGSSTPAASETSGSAAPSLTASPTTGLPQHGGLVGIIDSARKVAVCANVRLYVTTVEGGLKTSSDQAFAALIDTLKQGPRETGLDALVGRWGRWRTRVGDAETARRLTAFCAS
jgi:hypothetical protein